MKICSWRFFLFEDLFMEIFPWRFILEIFPLDFWKFFKKICSWRFFFLKICSWRFFLEDLFWRLNFWKNFNEDLFMEIFPLEYGFGDFSFWRFVRGDFSLKIYFGDWTFEKILMKICSWRFFLEDLFLEIFPLKFWKFLLKICSLSKKSEEDEDDDGVKVMKIIYSWWFLFSFSFFEKPIFWMRITLAESWCRLLDKSLLNSCKKIISISNGFIHWNELEVLTQCP